MKSYKFKVTEDQLNTAKRVALAAAFTPYALYEAGRAVVDALSRPGHKPEPDTDVGSDGDRQQDDTSK